jgi:hypothetical protein
MTQKMTNFIPKIIKNNKKDKSITRILRTLNLSKKTNRNQRMMIKRFMMKSLSLIKTNLNKKLTLMIILLTTIKNMKVLQMKMEQKVK